MNKKLGYHRTCRVVIRNDRGRVILKGKCINARLSPEIIHSQVYHDLIAREPEMADIFKFMRRYSEDHNQKYPLNAIYKGTKFYLAEGVEQHKPALDLYEIYKIETGKDFERFGKECKEEYIRNTKGRVRARSKV